MFAFRLLLLLLVLVGVLFGKYVRPITNFALMMLTFDAMTVLLVVIKVAKGDSIRLHDFGYAVTCTIAFVIPAIVGIVGGHHLSRGRNALLIAGTFYACCLVLGAWSGHFRPIMFIQAIFIGPGDLIMPAFLIFVAAAASLRRPGYSLKTGEYPV